MVLFSQVIDIEDFGTGTYPGAPLPAGQTSYNYNAPAQPATFPNILDMITNLENFIGVRFH